jgi:RNA recognition motif-containing protein
MQPIDPHELYDAYHTTSRDVPYKHKLADIYTTDYFPDSVEHTFNSLREDIDLFATYTPQPQSDTSRRTLYFGNLPPTISFEVFLNHIQGGIIEQVKILHDKQCAFVTFLDSDAAIALYNESQLKRFVIQGYDVRVGNALLTQVTNALTKAGENHQTRRR